MIRMSKNCFNNVSDKKIFVMFDRGLRSISPTSLKAAFKCAAPKSAKRYWSLDWISMLLWSVRIKALRKMLMKLRPKVERVLERNWQLCKKHENTFLKILYSTQVQIRIQQNLVWDDNKSIRIIFQNNLESNVLHCNLGI